MPEIAQQPVSVSVPTHPLPLKPPGVPPPPRVPPTAPRSDRQQQPRLKRRMSGTEGSPSSTRQKLDVPEVPTTTPINTQLQPTNPPTSPADRQHGSSAPGDATSTSPQPMQDQAMPSTHAHTLTAPRQPEPQTIPPSPTREPGEMTPQTILTPLSGPPSAGAGAGSGSTTRPPPPNHSTLSIPAPASPRPSSSSSGNGDSHAPRRRDRDANRLTRELWDTRRQLTAMQAREQVILDDLGRLGVWPENTAAGVVPGVHAYIRTLKLSRSVSLGGLICHPDDPTIHPRTFLFF
ncbi:hypothetical protein OG21DRAFT_1335175 [Imleria badia]|nr:hypothetical protein OG21DRAFT_1335175 [Imleria badia]